MLCGLSGTVFAIESPANKLQTRAAQTQTVRALQAINQNRWRVGEQEIAATRDALASKIYTWLVLTQREDGGSYTRLTSFIRKNPEWPHRRALIQRAEKDMPPSLSDTKTIAWFAEFEPRTAKGLDRYLGALTRAGRKSEAQNTLRKAWPDIRLSRDEQKKIFRRYGGLLSHKNHAARLDTLLFSKQYSNARAIAAVLGGGYPALAEARIGLAADKGDVNVLIARVPADLKRDTGLLYERLKWRRNADLNSGAIAILNAPPNVAKTHSPKAWWRERHIITRRLIENKRYKEAYKLTSGHIQQDGFSYAQAEWLSGWLALRFLSEPSKAYKHFTALHAKVKTPVSKARAAYWAGRASESFKDKTVSKNWYKKAAQFQTVYYGQLAAAKLGLAEKLPASSATTLTAADIARFKKNELIQAAKLFHVAGMRKEASTFLSAFTAHDKSAKAYRYSADLATKMRRYHDAVRISKKGARDGVFLTAQAYPVISERLAKIGGNGGVKTEWALVHALIRQESVFDARAKSPAGALGLMQLMPATAKETASKLGISHNKSWLTLRPDHNIRLGSAYLDRMLKRFDGSYPMAIAAYNAGPSRVDRWLKTFGDPRKGNIDWIDWIELIPIYETRNYVQRVMEGVYIYRLRLKNIQPTPRQDIHIALAK